MSQSWNRAVAQPATAPGHCQQKLVHGGEEEKELIVTPLKTKFARESGWLEDEFLFFFGKGLFSWAMLVLERVCQIWIEFSVDIFFCFISVSFLLICLNLCIYLWDVWASGTCIFPFLIELWTCVPDFNWTLLWVQNQISSVVDTLKTVGKHIKTKKCSHCSLLRQEADQKVSPFNQMLGPNDLNLWSRGGFLRRSVRGISQARGLWEKQ